jgi:hypothetical protein
MRRAAWQAWQEEWTGSTKGRWTFGLYPTVDAKRCFTDFLLNQFRTGHGAFAEHQARLFSKNPECPVCQVPGTIEHYISHCTVFAGVRDDYFPSGSSSVLSLLRDTKARVGLKMIAEELVAGAFAAP